MLSYGKLNCFKSLKINTDLKLLLFIKQAWRQVLIHKYHLLQKFSFISLFIFFCCQLNAAGNTSYIAPELQNAFHAKRLLYKVQSKYLLENNQPQFINRLILEDSPYLLQHAHNPVHWYAWGEAAFTAAQQQNKPVFLSIGYSTCFWCHVMNDKSFDNIAIAQVLNKHFISIKVDRESRPDIDAFYMTAVELMTGHSGWPLSVFLLPDGKAFLGGGYFPPEKFKPLLNKVNNLWIQQSELLVKKAQQTADKMVQKHANQSKIKTVDQVLINETVELILSQYDSFYGGFGYQAKFPHENWLLFLLDSQQRNPNTQVLQVIEKTLKAMAKGGIYDHIGGGFHRYSTDVKWLIPHFEKMLYNQAQLSQVYLLAYKLTGNKIYAETAKETIDYVLQELAYPVGGFYSASDAISEEKEGEYFVWEYAQIKTSLPPALADLAINLFNITKKGNFEGKNVLSLEQSLADYAHLKKRNLDTLNNDFSLIKKSLKTLRNQRTPPFKDRKIITSWNAMMIESLTMASELLNHPQYLVEAQKAAEFIWWNQYIKDKQLWRLFWQNRSSVKASQEDYAYYAAALLKLYDATGKQEWLTRAKQITDDMISLFWDQNEGGFFMNAVETGKLKLPFKAVKDNEIIAANAIAMTVLNRIYNRLGLPIYKEKSEVLLATFSPQFAQSPINYIGSLLSASETLYGEQGHIQYAAKGNVIIKGKHTQLDDEHTIKITISMQPGWHINAHQPLQSYLIPTSIKLIKGDVWTIKNSRYPKPRIKKLTFQTDDLALYTDSVEIDTVLLKKKGAYQHLYVEVNLQACNKEVCLPPESVLITIPVNTGV